MRWHVILAAMLAFILGIGMIAFLVNVINYHIVTNQADRTLSYIMKLESEHPGEQAAGPGQPKPFTALPDLEANYMTRFFIVRFDGNGNVTSTYMDYIAAIYDMYRYLEADASLYNYAKISVNGEYWSVYLALEAVKESFMLRNYGTQDGELYKPDSMEMGGENAGISSPSMPDKDSSDFDFQDIAISKFEGKTPPNSTGMSASQDSGSQDSASSDGAANPGNHVISILLCLLLVPVIGIHPVNVLIGPDCIDHFLSVRLRKITVGSQGKDHCIYIRILIEQIHNFIDDIIFLTSFNGIHPNVRESVLKRRGRSKHHGISHLIHNSNFAHQKRLRGIHPDEIPALNISITKND